MPPTDRSGHAVFRVRYSVFNDGKPINYSRGDSKKPIVILMGYGARSIVSMNNLIIDTKIAILEYSHLFSYSQALSLKGSNSPNLPFGV